MAAARGGEIAPAAALLFRPACWILLPDTGIRGRHRPLVTTCTRDADQQGARDNRRCRDDFSHKTSHPFKKGRRLRIGADAAAGSGCWVSGGVPRSAACTARRCADLRNPWPTVTRRAWIGGLMCCFLRRCRSSLDQRPRPAGPAHHLQKRQLSGRRSSGTSSPAPPAPRFHGAQRRIHCKPVMASSSDNAPPGAAFPDIVTTEWLKPRCAAPTGVIPPACPCMCLTEEAHTSLLLPATPSQGQRRQGPGCQLVPPGAQARRGGGVQGRPPARRAVL